MGYFAFSKLNIFLISAVTATISFCEPGAGQNLSTLCKFNNGPRAGQIQDYSPMPAIPVGSPCHDGVQSTGVVVQSGGVPGQALSSVCQFNKGPRTGQSQDYSPMAPIPVGSPCYDGLQSSGVVVPNGGVLGQNLSSICQFNNGPRAGQSQDYAPLAPIPVGSPCHDGFGSAGLVASMIGIQVVNGANSQTCLFHNGPSKGHAQFFPNVKPVQVGIPCWDGVSNYGITVADQSGNQFQSQWNVATGNPQTVPPPVGHLVQQVPSAPTPLEIGKNCALSGGGNEAMIAACMAQSLPPNVTQECLANPAACFGELSPITAQVAIGNGIAKAVGVDVQHIAQQVDKVWGKINPF